MKSSFESNEESLKPDLFSDTNLFIYLLFLQSFEHVWTRPTEQFRLMDCGVVCLSRYFTSMSNFLLAGCTE